MKVFAFCAIVISAIFGCTFSYGVTGHQLKEWCDSEDSPGGKVLGLSPCTTSIISYIKGYSAGHSLGIPQLQENYQARL